MISILSPLTKSLPIRTCSKSATTRPKCMLLYNLISFLLLNTYYLVVNQPSSQFTYLNYVCYNNLQYSTYKIPNLSIRCNLIDSKAA